MAKYIEREVTDDFPMYPGYWYVAISPGVDEPFQCEEYSTAGEYKQRHGIAIITTCDVVGRGLPLV